MKIKLIYPKWPKLKHQPEFHLPPHGPVVFAATLPRDIEVSFCDENVEAVDFSENADLVAISCMLTAQVERAFAIAQEFRSRGKKVIMGGIAAMLHAQEAQDKVDALF